MKVGFKYRKSGCLPEVKVPGTFYYLFKEHPELWFCFDENTVKRVDNEFLADDIKNAVDEYLDKNGIDLDRYLTKDDLEDYALKSDIPTRVEDLEDGSDYVTKEYLAGLIDEIPSLGGYATEEWVKEQGYATMSDIPNRVRDLVDGSDYVNIMDLLLLLKEYATMSDIPTRVEDLEDASDYATKEWVLGLKDMDFPDGSDYLTEKDLENYYTKEEIDDKISNVTGPSSELRWQPFS